MHYEPCQQADDSHASSSSSPCFYRSLRLRRLETHTHVRTKVTSERQAAMQLLRFSFCALMFAGEARDVSVYCEVKAGRGIVVSVEQTETVNTRRKVEGIRSLMLSSYQSYLYYPY